MNSGNKSALEKLINIDVAKNAETENPFMNLRSFGVDARANAEEDAWPEFDTEPEGQLALDVFLKEDNLIVKSTIAGAKPEDIDVSIENDMLTIRGRREIGEEVNDEDYYYQECYWGNFSRSLILPFAIQKDHVRAELKNGVLTILLPKAERQENGIPIEIIEE